MIELAALVDASGEVAPWAVAVAVMLLRKDVKAILGQLIDHESRIRNLEGKGPKI